MRTSRLDDILARELTRGERVVWHGRPAPLSRVLASGRTFLFVIPFFAFSVFWTWSAGSKGRTVSRDVGFFGLDDARAVQQLLPVGRATTPSTSGGRFNVRDA